MNDLIQNFSLQQDQSNSDLFSMFTNSLSPQTKRMYSSDIKGFFGVNEFEEITVEMLQAVTPELANQWALQQKDNGLRESTINKKLGALQSLYSFLSRRRIGIMSYNPFETKEGCIRFKNANSKINVREPIEESYIKRMINVVPSEHKTKAQELIHHRDRLILEVLSTTGLRRDELCRLTVGSIKQYHNDFVLEVIGKGNKTRYMGLEPAILDGIKVYLRKRGLTLLDQESPLFSSHARNTPTESKLSGNAVNTIVKQYAKLAGLDEKEISTHTLRHTFCTESLRAPDVDIEDVRELMGHSSTSTTRIYDHIDRTIEHSTSEYLAKKYGITE